MADTRQSAANVDEAEVARFSALAEKWWDPAGPMAPLHKINPLRLAYIKDQVAARFGRDPKSPEAFAGLRILDVGCGAGLIAEPFRRLGADVVGIDPSEKNIAIAKLHAAEGSLAIDYRATTAEELAAAGERFDVITILEVVEHVPDVAAFVGACGSMLKPGGLMIGATINRTLKAFALAIVGAEYVLRWLPRGTHSYDKLVTPAEFADAFKAAGLEVSAETGVFYTPIADRWRLSRDMDVNYMMVAGRPG
jgi:2-polyprenyl-6-hydroxyphenyl methylase/3-demethylubiquinone-9 3-methyltransferase